MSRISLKQIRDLDKLPYYLNRLGELNIEDNNIVLNYLLTGDTNNKSIGGGITIQDGDGLGNDVGFSIISLLNLYSGQTEYISSGGSENRAWATQLNDILLKNNDINNPNGLRVIKEGDIVNGGVIGFGSHYSGSTRDLTYLNKILLNSGDKPSVVDLLPGQLAVNVTDGSLFTLVSSGNSYVVVEFKNSTFSGDSNTELSGGYY